MTVGSLDLALDQDDTERLLWARLPNWSLSEVRQAFAAVEEVDSRSERDLAVRLLAQLGNMTQDEADEFLSECDALRRTYGGDA
jgi:uncharacterized SAM-dependent methyltransferase